MAEGTEGGKMGDSDEEVHADSLRFKLAHSERALMRIKDENMKLKERIGSLEEDITMLKEDKTSFLDRLAKKEMEYTRLFNERQMLERTMEIRSQRHAAEQQENLTRGQKELLQMKMKEAEERILLSKEQTEKAVKQCHSLLIDIQQERQTRLLLQEQITILLHKEKQGEQTLKELQRLYSEKLRVLEGENRQLKHSTENLILDLKLHERRQQIEGLLSYEDSIGMGMTPSHPRSKYATTATHATNLMTQRTFNSDFMAQTFRERDCRCFELSEELLEYQEMVDLMKERNLRLESEVQSFKRRCVSLQSIICEGTLPLPLRR